jgi:predicted RNA-binding protein YlqC (UPF0109 family)
MSRARDVVEVIARALAATPGAVDVTQTDRRVIGRNGRTAAALRTLATAAGDLENLRVAVDFRDEP